MLLTTQRLSTRTKNVRDLISEVVGLSPYEKRLLDMLKTGGASSEKRMYKYAKRRVSTVLLDSFSISNHVHYFLVGHTQESVEEA